MMALSPLAGFSLLIAWTIAYPPVVLASSTLVWGNALLFGLVELAALRVAWPLAARKLRGRGAIAAAGAACLLAGVLCALSLAPLSPSAQVAVYAALVAAASFAIGCLAGRQESVPMRGAMRCALAALVIGGAVVCVALLISYPLGWAANFYAQALFGKALIGCLPLVAGAILVASARRQAEASHPAPAVKPLSAPNARRSAADMPAPLLGLLGAASLSTMLLSGLVYQPYLFVGSLGTLTHWLQAFIAAAIGALLLVGLHRRFASSGAATLRATARPLFCAAMVAAVLAMAACLLCALADLWVAIMLLRVARACCWALTVFTACALDGVTLPSGERKPLSPAWRLNMVVASGAFWAECLGIGVTRAVGLSLSLAGAVAVAVMVAVALASLVLANRTSNARVAAESLARPETVASAAAEAKWAFGITQKAREQALAHYGLTRRETQVALLVLEGATAASISTTLEISESTVRFHIGNVYKKADVQSKNELLDLTRRNMMAAAAEEEGANSE